MPHSFTVINLVTLITYLATVILALPLCRLRPETRGYILPFWLMALHGAVFYTVLAWAAVSGLSPFWHDTFDFMEWSSVLRLHGSVTILGAAVFVLADAVRDGKHA